MFDPNATQRVIVATQDAARSGARHARRGYAWVSLFVMAVMIGAVCVKVIIEVLQ